MQFEQLIHSIEQAMPCVLNEKERAVLVAMKEIAVAKQKVMEAVAAKEAAELALTQAVKELWT